MRERAGQLWQGVKGREIKREGNIGERGRGEATVESERGRSRRAVAERGKRKRGRGEAKHRVRERTAEL